MELISYLHRSGKMHFPLLLCLAAGMYLIAGGCAKVEVLASKVEPGNPQYLALYSLSDKPDRTHTVKVLDREGRVWYRERQPIIDLRHVEWDKPMVSPVPDGGARIVLLVERSYQQRLVRWSEAHMGQWAGFVLDGRVVQAARIEWPLKEVLQVCCFKSLDEALAVAKVIKAGGGFVRVVATRPAESG